MKPLLEELDERSSQIRFEAIDFSVGELIRLHSDREVLIQPAFQRMFRWTQAQQSRLIESMLLGLPVPQIVLFQREDGVLELIDGLQRISSLIQFITGRPPAASEPSDENPGQLIGCDMLPSLNSRRFTELEPVMQLELKRKTLRAIVIRRTNDPNLRYEMFKRLNTGGSPAEAHEVRNASLRIFGTLGETFLTFLGECSNDASFIELTETLSEQAQSRLGREELVLRFFALKNARNSYKGSISDWLDEYSEAVVKQGVVFDYAAEKTIFQNACAVMFNKFGTAAFLKHKSGRPIGGLAPAYFDAVTMGILPVLGRLGNCDPAQAKEILNDAVGHDNDAFRTNVGPGANSVKRLNARIAEVERVFGQRLPK